MSPPAPEILSTADVEQLAARFRAAAIPVAEWTHAAHIKVATWHVDHLGATEALAQMRAGILALNEQHGTPNTPTRGYHETITVAYVQLIADFLASCPASEDLGARTTRLLAGPIGVREVLLRHWSRERLMSPEARAAWLPPDLAPLPALPPATRPTRPGF
jgi:hypothetical protein